MSKLFVIINMAYIGDVMICSALCAEIKKHFPDSKLVFITNPASSEVAEGIPFVDEVVVYDKKNKHKGFFGLFKFIKEFKYRGKIDVCFPIHSYDRGNVLAFLLGAKKRIANKQERNFTRFLLNGCRQSEHIHVLDRTSELITSLVDEEPSSSMSYKPDKYHIDKAFELIKESGYDSFELVALCTNTKNPIKDWNAKEATDFIELVNKSGRRVVWVGTSNSKEIAHQVQKTLGNVFLNLIDKTDISTLGGVLAHSKALVSVDTGTMHIGVAMQKPVVALFFVPHLVEEWAPKDKKLNRVILNEKGICAAECFEKLNELI